MNLIMLNSYDSAGGAAIATYRLHRGLRSVGVDSHMMVLRKGTDDCSVIGPLNKWERARAILRTKLVRVSAKLFRGHQQSLFSPAWLPERLASKVAKFSPDIVHLFWVSDGFFRIETLKTFKQPIVWTLHDMWPFTGGCHYDDECGKFRQSCGNCPVLRSESEHDLSRRVWARKRKSWEGVPIVVVATSYWLADMARSSSLFRDRRVEVIPNGIDTEKYKPMSKEAARAAYMLPQDKHLILFSAFNATSDKRKGNQFLARALEIMSQAGWGSKTELVIIGATRPEVPHEMGMKVHYMGHLHDEISQVVLYSAADVVAAPSMQENLSNTVLESLSCGTPVVAFNIGGMPDMIDHRINGYLATPFEPTDLARGMMWVLENKDRHAILSQRARQTVVERYPLLAIANRYLALYQSMLK
ncbi:MAG: glycosyltransferase [Nitrospira sp.]|nr:MAG: glycosyltransferase [Nitrospira sp.]